MTAPTISEHVGGAFTPPSRPRPWLSALLTILLPGLGQLYNGRPLRAAATYIGLQLFVAALLLATFVAPTAAFRIALMLAGIPSLILLPLDAARTARRDVPPHRLFRRWYM